MILCVIISCQDKFKVIRHLDKHTPYICVSCRSTRNGGFDFAKGMKRINFKTVRAYHQLHDACTREAISLDLFVSSPRLPDGRYFMCPILFVPVYCVI